MPARDLLRIKSIRPFSLLTMLAVPACADGPSGPSTRAPDPAPHPSVAAESRDESPYGCYVSEAVRNPHYRYRYSRRELRFPSPAIAPDGATLEYRLRLREPGREPAYVANCIIPRTRTAVRLLEEWLRVPRDVRYTVAHRSGRTGTAIAMLTDEPCNAKVGDVYDPIHTCATIEGITATGTPQPWEPSTEPAPPPPSPEMPPGEGGGTGGSSGGDEPCYECSYDSSGTAGCTPSVPRGVTVICEITAARQGESDLVVHSWTFVDADGRGTATTDPVVRWSGTAVVGGTVTVRFDDGGGPRELVSSFTVTPRGWTWAGNAESAYHDGTGPTWCIDYTPTFSDPNGVNLPTWAANCSTGERMIQPDSYAPAGDGFTVATVAGGPNQGLHYIPSARLYLRRQSTYNPGLSAGASRVTLKDAQRASCGAQANWYQFSGCMGYAGTSPGCEPTRGGEPGATTGTSARRTTRWPIRATT